MPVGEAVEPGDNGPVAFAFPMAPVAPAAMRATASSCFFACCCCLTTAVCICCSDILPGREFSSAATPECVCRERAKDCWDLACIATEAAPAALVGDGSGMTEADLAESSCRSAKQSAQWGNEASETRKQSAPTALTDSTGMQRRNVRKGCRMSRKRGTDKLQQFRPLNQTYAVHAHNPTLLTHHCFYCCQTGFLDATLCLLPRLHSFLLVFCLARSPVRLPRCAPLTCASDTAFSAPSVCLVSLLALPSSASDELAAHFFAFTRAARFPSQQ